ncbi:START domain-containing protein [Cinnamomum micranthum f. kanehirae]|uniref:START domain-containing protein n=1 Tax=Cinnamomum micranthum f. kanehirae TaxID=337451 RepID=A0A443P746_9MAGN|nr:START domain-containing protein [Cinnamomum micranthum f. kanehirae]
MEEVYGDFMEFMKRPALMEAFIDILLCAVPIWLAVMIGLVIGWSWRPRWTGIVFLGLRSRFRFIWTAPPGFGARRLWLAFTAFSAFSLCRRLWSKSSSKDKEEGSPAGGAQPSANVASVEPPVVGVSSRSVPSVGDEDIVTEDLEHLRNLLEGKVGDAMWQNLMERSTPTMTYQAWRHEPEEGPPIYRSRTVFEDATPELVRDFFWDDEFRAKWDPMMSYFKLLEECPHTGISVVHWIKKFPFFCSDREYIIGRRIWESSNSRMYYCITKGVPYQAIPKRDKPRRVELYFSSWTIRAVQSRKGDGQLSACEVCFVHYEDMGIPKDVAKVGVRHGMWGTVKKLQSGMRTYQLARKSGALPSQSALSGRITTKIPLDSSIGAEDQSILDEKSQPLDLHKMGQGAHWKWLLIGGTVVLACGLHTGIVGKALFLGAAGRLGRK